MTNYQGQVFKDMLISAPIGAHVFDKETNQIIKLNEKKHLEPAEIIVWGLGVIALTCLMWKRAK